MKTRKETHCYLMLLCMLCSGLSYRCAAPGPEKYPEKPVLSLVSQIPLTDVAGRIDHICYDSMDHLAFVAALGNNTVEVVDLNTGLVTHTIRNLHAPQGLAYLPGLNQLFEANGDDGVCTFYDAETFAPSGSVNLNNDADNVRYDPSSKQVYVGYGDGGIAIIDALSKKQQASIPLDGHPESFQIDKRSERMYINVPDADEIEIADIASRRVTGKWKMASASANFPMALDDEGSRLFIGCRRPARLISINTQTGAEIQSVSCAGDADDVYYDENDGLVFVSAGKGFIDVFAAGNELKPIEHIPTRTGARTSLYLPSVEKLLLAVPAGNGKPAALWVYQLRQSVGSE